MLFIRAKASSAFRFHSRVLPKDISCRKRQKLIVFSSITKDWYYHHHRIRPHPHPRPNPNPNPNQKTLIITVMAVRERILARLTSSSCTINSNHHPISIGRETFIHFVSCPGLWVSAAPAAGLQGMTKIHQRIFEICTAIEAIHSTLINDRSSLSKWYLLWLLFLISPLVGWQCYHPAITILYIYIPLLLTK